MTTTIAAADVTPQATTAGTEFYSALQAQAMAAVGNVYHADFVPVQYPAQGDFPWYWQNANQVFNNATYGYVNALAGPGDVPGTVKLSAAGSFANAYVSVLRCLTYSLSQADQQKLDQAQANASAQQGTVVSDYQATYGTITSEQLEKAGVSTKIDYVISYIFGSVWSGATVPLKWTQMAAARDLSALLPDAPASASQVITDVETYLNLMAPVNSLNDLRSNGDWVLSQLTRNSTSPSSANGGIVTFDPDDGSVLKGRNVGWGGLPPVQSISNDLQNTSRTITLSLETSSASSSSIEVSVEGRTGFSVGSWLEFSVGASAGYDMSRFAGTSADAAVELTFPGWTVVPCSPSAWNQATDAGFYWPDPIAEAVQNQGKDVTGFRFVAKPPYDLGPLAQGGDFGLITGVLICNYPTVKITYSHADYAAFTQDWSEKVSGNLTLFGFIDLGRFSQGAYSSQVQAGADNSSFTVTFTPSPQLVAVPLAQQTAFVLGAAVANPGATAPEGA